MEKNRRAGKRKGREQFSNVTSASEPRGDIGAKRALFISNIHTNRLTGGQAK